MKTETIISHTPGPWSAHICPAERKYEHYVTAGLQCQVPIARTGRWDRASAADARLIAASPELLKALTLCLEVLDQIFDGHDKPQGCREIARKVIAKATP